MIDDQKVDINSSRAITAIIIINVVAAAAFLIQPAFVEGIVSEFGFTEQQAGQVAAAEMWGMALATVIFTFFSNRFNWHYSIIFAVASLCCANALSFLFQDIFNFSIIRGVAGVGEGILVSLGFTMVGLTRDPDRIFGLMIMWVVLFGGVFLALFPVIQDLAGMNGIFGILAAVAFSVLFSVKELPHSAEERVLVPEDCIDLPRKYRVSAILSLATFFVGIGAIWTYLFLIGMTAGGEPQEVANTFLGIQFLGAIGAFSTVVLGNRYGRILPLSCAFSVCILSQLFLYNLDGKFLTFIIAVCVFNFSYNMVQPYLYAALSSIDTTGGIIRFGIAGQMVGIAIGPSIASLVVSENNFAGVVTVTVTFFVLSMILALPVLFKHRREMQASGVEAQCAG